MVTVTMEMVAMEMVAMVLPWCHHGIASTSTAQSVVLGHILYYWHKIEKGALIWGDAP